MDKFSRRTALFLFWFIIVSLQIPSTIGEGQQQVEKNEQEQTTFGKTMQDTVNVLYDTISVLQKSHQNAWDKVKTIISEMQLQFSPPNLDFRGADEADGKGSTGGVGMGAKLKEAAHKSFETGKHTVEESAKSAGAAVGETMHKTAEKVKERVSHEEPHAEL
ncbi:hypothetical protein PRUPE_6G170400 [Prunus persica]|uniref:Uncharacterized protein n=1 Tax=Prunus persica TaxID=3760 RepID=A0A251NRN2_PRUPE|nr:uncharacterized protein LOC18775424 isoform X1 [Prunus persica]ONI01979.1 hypothetical protein PRUPE_6G170400 [Prunus persica]